MQLERLKNPGRKGTALWLSLALALVLGSWMAFGPAFSASADTSPPGCSANNLALDVERTLAPGEIGPVNASVVSSGQEILYTVSVDNHNGDGCDVINATVKLTLPAADGTATGTVVDLTPDSALYDGTDADFPVDHTGDTIYPDVSYTVSVNPGVTVITAQADVIAPQGLLDTPDGTPGDLVQISKTVSSTVTTPDLVIEKTPDGGAIQAGDTASFSITVTNNGPGVALDVALDDDLPAGYTWTENPDVAECTIAGGSLHCDIGDMASGDSFSVTVETPTSYPDDCGVTLNNLAVASGSNAAEVSDNGDISVSCPQLTIEKTPDGGTVVAPGTASFTIVLTNNGPGVATGVVIDDDLPAGYTWTENPDAGECDITAGHLHCDVGNLNDGQSVSVTVEAPVSDPGDCDDVLLNSVTASATNNGTVTDNGDITVECQVPQLTIDKTPDGGTIDPGDTAAFTIVVTNLGPGTAYSAVLDDELPAGYTWVEDPDTAECDISGGTTLHCDLGDMAPADSFSVTVSADTDPAVPDCVLENVATASALNNGTVSDPGDIKCTSKRVASVTTFFGGDSASGGTPWGAAAMGFGLAGLLGGTALAIRRRNKRTEEVSEG
jgi:uncharacterized repeat protein (TIGR01451 family)